MTKKVKPSVTIGVRHVFGTFVRRCECPPCLCQILADPMPLAGLNSLPHPTSWAIHPGKKNVIITVTFSQLLCPGAVSIGARNTARMTSECKMHCNYSEGMHVSHVAKALYHTATGQPGGQQATRPGIIHAPEMIPRCQWDPCAGPWPLGHAGES